MSVSHAYQLPPKIAKLVVIVAVCYDSCRRKTCDIAQGVALLHCLLYAENIIILDGPEAYQKLLLEAAVYGGTTRDDNSTRAAHAHT